MCETTHRNKNLPSRMFIDFGRTPLPLSIDYLYNHPSFPPPPSQGLSAHLNWRRSTSPEPPFNPPPPSGGFLPLFASLSALKRSTGRRTRWLLRQRPQAHIGAAGVQPPAHQAGGPRQERRFPAVRRRKGRQARAPPELASGGGKRAAASVFTDTWNPWRHNHPTVPPGAPSSSFVFDGKLRTPARTNEQIICRSRSPHICSVTCRARQKADTRTSSDPPVGGSSEETN